MRKLIVALACLAGLAAAGLAGEDKTEKVKFRLHGIVADKDGAVLAEALGKLPTVKVTGKPTQEDPTVVVSFTLGKTDVGEMANAVGAAKTSGRSQSKPRATLLLEYTGLDGRAAPDGAALLRIVKDAFPKLKGVDAERSSFELKSKSLLIMFDGSGKAKLAELRKGFPGLSVK